MSPDVPPLPVFDSSSWVLLSVPADHKTMTLYGSGGKLLAVVDLDNGKVTLHGDPNAAARVFWKAVEFEKIGVCRK